ncbi:lysozyme [Leptolyngbya sp. Heron Island J]|uniref:lysozyme n=1 Tax=Leptolyngbya sp. Heron Island J TaxID=1385935 RepID=UPI0003B9D716|nr:lysozyme [Leptolyngbya sp. Heron Island J]ESA32909.1 lysozyme [Leptolyngbya sp. Heron Island J]
MGTWIKETDKAIYLMQGGYYISKISKYPSKSNPNEKVLNISGMKSWFTRADSPRGMTVSQTGPEPKPFPRQSTPPTASPPTTGARQTNASGVHLIKTFEGLRLKAYQDAVGVWTIGYGTTRGVKPGQAISEAQAEALLKADLNRFEKAVNQTVRVSINDNQFAALVSFAYNVGSGALRSSTLIKKLNRRDIYGAANEFPRWNRAGGRVLAGLTRRRNAERALFLGQDYRRFL